MWYLDVTGPIVPCLSETQDFQKHKCKKTLECN